LKPYKTEQSNNQVRQAVRTANDYFSTHISTGWKYLSNDEFTQDICRICNISYNMAAKVTWFIRSDAGRDLKALQTWGFNKHTA